MKILLTGSHGFLGTYFRNKSGFKDITCWDHKVNKDIKAIKVENLKGIDIVIHLAASISVDESWEHPEVYAYNNSLLTLHLIKDAVKAGVKKFIFASSAAVHGPSFSPYGVSKLAAEDLLMCYQDKIDIRILRFYNIYGKGHRGIVNKMIAWIREGKPIQMTGDGKQTRDFIYIDDIVKVIKLICLKQSKPGLIIYEIGTGIQTNLTDLAYEIMNLMKKAVDINYVDLPSEIKYSYSQGSRLIKFIPLKRGLKKLLNET